MIAPITAAPTPIPAAAPDEIPFRWRSFDTVALGDAVEFVADVELVNFPLLVGYDDVEDVADKVGSLEEVSVRSADATDSCAG